MRILCGNFPDIEKTQNNCVIVKDDLEKGMVFNSLSEKLTDIQYVFQGEEQKPKPKPTWDDIFAKNKPNKFPARLETVDSKNHHSNKIKVRNHVYDLVRKSSNGKGFYPSELLKRTSNSSGSDRKENRKSLSNEVLDIVADSLFYVRSREALLDSKNCGIPSFFNFTGQFWDNSRRKYCRDFSGSGLQKQCERLQILLNQVWLQRPCFKEFKKAI